MEHNFRVESLAILLGEENGDGVSDDGGISDEDSNTLDTISGFSSGSSPLPMEPFRPLLRVRLTGEVSKSGDTVLYTLKSCRTCEEEKYYIVQRQYEDFQYLEHMLTTANPAPGLIVPPLPVQPAATTEMAQALSKKQLGHGSKALLGDQFGLDCIRLETYLRLLLWHPVYGRDPALDRFLTEKQVSQLGVSSRFGTFEA